MFVCRDIDVWIFVSATCAIGGTSGRNLTRAVTPLEKCEYWKIEIMLIHVCRFQIYKQILTIDSFSIEICLSIFY